VAKLRRPKAIASFKRVNYRPLITTIELSSRFYHTLWGTDAGDRRRPILNVERDEWLCLWRRRAPTPGPSERRAAHTWGAMRQNRPAAAGLGQQRGRQQKVRHARAACARTNAKGADARSAGARASASTSAKGADARSAGGRACASTSVKGANARSAGGRAKQPVAWRASAVLTDRRGTAPQGPVVPCQDVVCRACYAQCAHRNGRGISLHSEDTCSSTAAHCPAHICSGVHTLKADGKRSTIRLHVFKGMGVLQKLLGQSNTVQRLQADGRPDTQGGQVSVPTPSSLVACLRCRVPDCWRSPCRCYDYVRAAHV